MRAEEIVALLNLQPHPREGGWFRETYRSRDRIPANLLPAGFPGPRSLATAIFYLLAPGTCSLLHRLRADEVWHFYIGDPVEMLLLGPRSGEIVTLGQDLAGGMQVQVVVPRGTWQGCRLKAGEGFALMGTSLSPGFDYADHEMGNAEELVAKYPGFSDVIGALTRPGGGS
jgi:predicted cupin superfamily sugar epimerase